MQNNITNVNSHSSMYDITTVAYATSDDVSIYGVITITQGKRLTVAQLLMRPTFPLGNLFYT